MSVDWRASNLYGLSSNFKPQSSNSVDADEASNVLDAQGNVACEVMINGKTDYPNSFGYCNASPDIGSDLGTMLSQFGDVVDSKKPVQMVITFEAGKQATVDIDGHNHDSNPHVSGSAEGYADFSTTVPAGSGFGVPTWVGQSIGADASPIRAVLTLSFTHTDRIGADGQQFVGKNLTPRAELTIDFEGIPVTPLATGWTQDTGGPGDANTDPDSSTITMHRHFDLAA